MSTFRFIPAFAGVAFCLSVLMPAAKADVKLPSIFSDHMVLQRGMKVPVWGMAAADEKVTVAFKGQIKTTTADKEGKWRIQLDPLEAGGPEQITISGTNSVTIRDVLIGDVWVGSGQSNMAGGTGGYARRDEELAKLKAAAPYPKLRLFKSGGRNVKWMTAEAKSINGFSALMFSFGSTLQKELDVPVGLMVGAVGGTPSGYWLSMEAIEADGPCQEAIKAYVAKHSVEVLQKRYEKAVAKWEKAAAKAKEAGKRSPRKPRPFQTPGDLSNRRIGNLYLRFIRPLIPYGIKGVLWDQGESGTRVMELDQYTIMGALIKGWRNEWGQGEFPFLYIQKPSGGGVAWDKEANKTTRMADKFAGLPKGQTKDGNYRELHTRIMAYPNTAMVTCIDLGPGIHPINKSGYGARACQVALGHVYEKKVAIYGPIYGSHKIEGNKIRITFKHVGQGLAFKYGDKLQGFAIAGEDKVFHWAESVIDGNDVIVSSVKVAAPVAVRFGWARRRAWANLFNKDGLPALSFRTDSW